MKNNKTFIPAAVTFLAAAWFFARYVGLGLYIKSLASSKDAVIPKYDIEKSDIKVDMNTVSAETEKKFADILNDLQLVKIGWNGLSRRYYYDVYAKETKKGNNICLKVFSQAYRLTKFEYDDFCICGRFVTFYSPKDGTDSLYIIKNYDKNDPPAAKLNGLLGKKTLLM